MIEDDCRLVREKGKSTAKVYARILLAANDGRGVRLSAEECDLFWMDDAVVTAVSSEAERQRNVSA
jgi:hypothetical protein